MVVPVVNAQVVENAKYGFSLVVPDTWKVIQGQGESQGTLLFRIFDKERDGRMVVSAMPPYPLAMDNAEYGEILDIFIDRFGSNRPDVKIESKKKELIANQDANIAIYSWPRKDGGKDVLIKAVFWINDTILDINAAVKAEYREQGMQIFSEILKSIKLNNMTSRDWAKLGYSYKQSGKYEKAGEAFANASRLHPKNVDDYYELAYSNAENENYSQAVSAISKAIELKPKVAFYYQERVYSYIKLKNAEAALADANQAIKLDPNRAIFYAGRGNAYVLMKKYPDAIKDFEKCLELKGTPLDSQFNLGQVYELMGNREQALYYYSIISKIPDLPEPVRLKVQSRTLGNWENYQDWL